MKWLLLFCLFVPNVCSAGRTDEITDAQYAQILRINNYGIYNAMRLPPMISIAIKNDLIINEAEFTLINAVYNHLQELKRGHYK